MKYIKTYENIKIGDIKIGDIVTCIDNTAYERILRIGNTYKIDKICGSGSIIKLYDTQHFKNINFHRYMGINRFRKATTEEIKEYEIQQDVKDFNL